MNASCGVKWRGQKIDILDEVDEVYCPGIIVDLKGSNEVVVRYLGWGDEWDETVASDGA
jgi:hypothetical protein